MVQHELFKPGWTEHGFGTRLQDFQNLMRRRIRDVLLVSSPYDLYLFEEEGRLYELIRDEYAGLHLSYSPEITRVSSGAEAIALLSEENHFDLVITTLHIEDMTAVRLARILRSGGLKVPIILLAYDNRELKDLLTHQDTTVFDRCFVWQGDFRLLIAIIKHLEDRMNVDRDTSLFGVQCIILIEDNIRWYSTFLPLVYTELLKHSLRLISEGVNLYHRSLRIRARPKILLATTYDEARGLFDKYEEYILGVISDVDFPRRGEHDPRAGIAFAEEVKKRFFDVPILLQSTTRDHESEAHAIGASFLLKDSPSMLDDVRGFMTRYFSFGDFVFRTPDGREVGRATDLKSLEDELQRVPDECILFHGERNHFSNWLKARTEFWLAHKLRPRRVSDYASVAELREDLIRHLRENRRVRQLGMVTEFSRDSFDPNNSFARIGGGSIGGKARGLGFVNAIVSSFDVGSRFDGVDISVPTALVIGTEVFDRFLAANDLREFALACDDDREIVRRFLAARHFPEEIVSQLSVFLELVQEPLAVRSSSLLEDSQYHPFAGVYQTYMIPNNSPELQARLGELIATVRRVYASTFFRPAKDYIRVTSYKLEDEKMAVIVQKMVGSRHGSRFYPEISGVARSYNFYPSGPQTPQDGIVSAALGLGRIVVDGGVTVRFCPKYPDHLMQFHSPAQALKNNQQHFYALDMDGSPLAEEGVADALVLPHPLAVADGDGTLGYVASTYSHENDALYDGVSRQGTRIVTLAPVLRGHAFPLAEITEVLSNLGSWGMGTPVEIEFAVNLSVPAGAPRRFGILQMRPLVRSHETDDPIVDDGDLSKIVCRSSRVLGHGTTRDLVDLVVIDAERFDRARSRDAAKEIAALNEKLITEGRRYVLIGPGRWGSLDPWLGIPVKWDQICGARAIVEAELRDIAVDPSQGSHFFQNITSFQVSYFSASAQSEGFVDWKWLAAQPAVEERSFARHLRFAKPLVVKVNGHENKGVILKPE